MNIIWFLIIGAVAGWLAGLLTKGKGFGVLGGFRGIAHVRLLIWDGLPNQLLHFQVTLEEIPRFLHNRMFLGCR